MCVCVCVCVCESSVGMSSYLPVKVEPSHAVISGFSSSVIDILPAHALCENEHEIEREN